ncbi:uncharacterized protein LOC123542152 [Mercenaria mercenaria]|uniref:uncharacterized protein LOC123542152 n=1 Tax=Mercenaria mercenaria TaxID=6596 RepID=UPI001E1DDAD2|nr:uncharacterized protein LOC123542152 [Mercenaria mercenaria]
MVALAKSITECPDIERIWHVERSNTSVSVTTGKFLLSHSDVGPYIHIICPEGSHVVGPSMITCLEGGAWDDVTEPSCSTSSLYGVAQSDIVLIGVLAGCGAIVILALTIILAHLLCFKKRDIHSARSTDRLERNSDSPPSTSIYLDDKHFHSISTPTSAMLNGRPLTHVSRSNHNYGSHVTQNYDTRSLASSVIMSYNSGEHEYSLPRYYLQRQLEYPHPASIDIDHVYTDPTMSAHAQQLTATPIEDDNVFVNEAFTEEFPSRDYRANWENSINSHQARASSLNSLPPPPVFSYDNRTTF